MIDSNSTAISTTAVANGTVISSSGVVGATDAETISAMSSSGQDSLANDGSIGNVFEENMYAFIGAGAALLLICLFIIIVCVARSRRKRQVTTIHAAPVDYEQPVAPPTPYLRQQEEAYGSPVQQPSLYDTVGGAVVNAATYGDHGHGQSTMQTLDSPRPDQYQALPSHADSSSASRFSPPPSMPSSPRPLLQRDDSGVNF
jgi:hypothetical protein